MYSRKTSLVLYIYVGIVLAAVLLSALFLNSCDSMQETEGQNSETSTSEVTGATETEAFSSPEITTKIPETTEIPETTVNPETEPVVTGTAGDTTQPDVPLTEPVLTEPVLTEPVSTEPVSTEPPETEPAVTEAENPDGSFKFAMSFVGDVQFADNYNDEKKNFASTWGILTPEHYLSGVRDVFAADDYTLVNLEFVVSDRELERVSKSGTAYWYCGSSAYLEALTCSSVEAVSLTNNHLGDYKKEGEADTLAAVLSSGMAAGTYKDIIYVEKNGYTVAIICDAMYYSGHKYDILPRIKEAETKSDFQVVYWHGGSREYQKYPDQWEIDVCHELVDAGADLIIGNHPHVLQTMEIYNGVRILYSLGNFCYSGMMSLNKATVIYQLELTVSKDGVLVQAGENIIPCYYYSGLITNPVTGKMCQNFRPCILTDEAEIKQVMDFLDGKVDTPMLE